MYRTLVLAGVAALFAAASPCQAQERFYVMVFGSQRTPPNPAYSHSFAVFVKETCLVGGQRHLEHITISWLPSTMVVRLNALCPESGTNFDIHTTFQWAYNSCQRVSMWGPYETCPEFWCQAVKQYNVLNSGKVRYKAVDTGYPTSRVSNCIHALGSVAGGYRVRVFSPGWGETASYAITLRYSKWFVNPDQKHLWLLPPLGLGKYPLIHRDLEAPRSGGFWSLFRTFTGHEENFDGPYVLDPCPAAPALVPTP